MEVALASSESEEKASNTWKSKFLTLLSQTQEKKFQIYTRLCIKEIIKIFREYEIRIKIRKDPWSVFLTLHNNEWWHLLVIFYNQNLTISVFEIF